MSFAAELWMCEDDDAQKEEKENISQCEDGDVAEKTVLEAHGQVDGEADEPSEGTYCSTRVNASELKEFCEDTPDAKRCALRSGGKDLTEEIDNIVLTHGDSNEEIS